MRRKEPGLKEEVGDSPTLRITTHTNNSSTTFPEQDRPLENQDALHISDQNLKSNDKFRIRTRPEHRRPSGAKTSPAWAAGAERGRAQGHGPARPAAPSRAPGPAAAQPGGGTLWSRCGQLHAPQGPSSPGTTRPPTRPQRPPGDSTARPDRACYLPTAPAPARPAAPAPPTAAPCPPGCGPPSRRARLFVPGRGLAAPAIPDPHRAAAPAGSAPPPAPPTRGPAGRPRARAPAFPRAPGPARSRRCSAVPPGAPWCARQRERKQGGGCRAGARDGDVGGEDRRGPRDGGAHQHQRCRRELVGCAREFGGGRVRMMYNMGVRARTEARTGMATRTRAGTSGHGRASAARAPRAHAPALPAVPALPAPPQPSPPFGSREKIPAGDRL